MGLDIISGAVDKEIMRQQADARYTDVQFDVAFSTTGPGTFILATTGANYFGICVVASSAGATIRVYDSISAASGTILWQSVIGATVSTESGRYNKVVSKNGLVLFSTLSTGCSHTVYFGPKG